MTGIDPSAGYGYAPHTESDEENSVPVVNWIGAASSLALVIGLSVWGWQTVQRDVTGIPVIQSISDPMRVRPDNPGGAQADHQGLSVNEVQSGGRAGQPVEQVVLAPPPLDLSTNGQSNVPQSQSNGSSAIAPLTPDMTPEQQKAALDAMAAALAAGIAPLEQTVPSGTGVLPTSIPGISRSLRPIARPASLQQRIPVPSQSQVVQTPQPQAALPSQFVDPNSIAAGTRLVQFGAFDSAEIAQREWTRLSGRFSSFLSDKRPVIQQAISGGREFHRLRVMAFDDVGDARRFCSIFLAENTPCIPVVAK